MEAQECVAAECVAAVCSRKLFQPPTWDPPSRCRELCIALHRLPRSAHPRGSPSAGGAVDASALHPGLCGTRPHRPAALPSDRPKTDTHVEAPRRLTAFPWGEATSTLVYGSSALVR